MYSTVVLSYDLRLMTYDLFHMSIRKIKILYGLEAAGGGALKHLVYLATRLNPASFDITVILSDQRRENMEAEMTKLVEAGVKIIIWPMKRSLHVSDLIIGFQLVAHIKKHRYDIVHAHSSKAGGLFRIAAWLNRVPYICYTPHCFYFQGKKGGRKLFFILLEKMLGLMTSAIIVSENEQKELVKYHIVNPRKAFNINNAIDFNDYQQNKELAQTRKQYGLKQHSIIVGAIGRLVPQKDWETYIYAAREVLQKYPGVEFLIVGEGELYGEIKKQIFGLNLENNVFLTGYVQKVYKLYGIIDIYVNTSLWEGLPYVMLEAMQYKKPIVATDTGNTNMILHEETGFVTPVKDYKSIARQIIYLIEHKKLAVKMGERGNDLLTEKYSFEKFIKEHEKMYKNAPMIQCANRSIN
jgi:glycosyltransferase involved in cell wall biosynthesis